MGRFENNKKQQDIAVNPVEKQRETKRTGCIAGGLQRGCFVFPLSVAVHTLTGRSQ